MRTGRRRTIRGATAVEYALMLLLVAMVIVGVVALFGDQVSGLFGDSTTTIDDAIQGQ